MSVSAQVQYATGQNVAPTFEGWERNPDGSSTLAEYGLLLALIAVVCLGAITVLGSRISLMFSTLSTSI
jgi:pilus assembly protein Flp/PilA